MEHPKDREFRKAYEKAVASGDAQGSMANWMNDNAKNGLVKKLDAYCEHISARMEAEEKKEPHTYGEIVRAIAKANDDIAKYKGVPERLLKEQRVKLNKQFDDLVDRGMYSESRREHWISQKLSEYFWSEEYRAARDNLMEAVKALDKYDDLKKIWEKKNHDIIEAERQRSKREELLSADPEALRALGITPPPVQKVSRAEEDPEFNETLEALRAIHPSATDAEIEQMAKLM